jgi:ABC-type cobalamin/Fe3+-siderophores transport system ATPase subunit
MSELFEMLRIDQLNLSRRDKSVLADISMVLEKGQMLAIAGPNGAGKTTLIKCIAGLESDFQGEIILNHEALSSLHLQRLAKILAYLPQQHDLQWPLAVRHVVELGRLPHQGYQRQLSKEDAQIVEQAMQSTDVIHLADRPANELSGGELARVMLARIFATKSSLILADEPTASLDPYHQLHLMELLREHCDRGGTAILVMHDLNLAARFCDQVVLLKNGRIVVSGAPATVLTDAVLAEVYGVAVERLGDLIVPIRRI